MTTEAAKSAKARYDAKTARYISLKLNKNTDADIISKLEQQESIQAYIKSLIRNDIKGGDTMTTITYRINPDYIDLWGDDANEDTTLTADDIESIARGWDKPVTDILPQLIPENYQAAVALMDDDIRESVHDDLAPCTDAEFLWEYCKRHEDKHGEPFAI